MTAAFANSPVSGDMTFDRERYGNTANPGGSLNVLDSAPSTQYTPGQYDPSYYEADPYAAEGGGAIGKIAGVGSVAAMAAPTAKRSVAAYRGGESAGSAIKTGVKGNIIYKKGAAIKNAKTGATGAQALNNAAQAGAAQQATSAASNAASTAGKSAANAAGQAGKSAAANAAKQTATNTATQAAKKKGTGLLGRMLVKMGVRTATTVGAGAVASSAGTAAAATTGTAAAATGTAAAAGTGGAAAAATGTAAAGVGFLGIPVAGWVIGAVLLVVAACIAAYIWWRKSRPAFDVDEPATAPCQFLPLRGDDETDAVIKDFDNSFVETNDALFGFDPARVGPNKDRAPGDEIVEAYSGLDKVEQDVEQQGRAYSESLNNVTTLIQQFQSEPKIGELYQGSEKTLIALSKAPEEAMTPSIVAIGNVGAALNSAYEGFGQTLEETKKTVARTKGSDAGEKIGKVTDPGFDATRDAYGQGMGQAEQNINTATDWVGNAPSAPEAGLDWNFNGHFSTGDGKQEEEDSDQRGRNPGMPGGVPMPGGPSRPAPSPAPSPSPGSGDAGRDGKEGRDGEDGKSGKDGKEDNVNPNRILTEEEVRRIIDEAGKARQDLSNFGNHALDAGQQMMNSPSNPFSPNSPFNPANPSNPFNPSNPNGLFGKLQQGLGNLTNGPAGLGGRPGQTPFGNGLGGPGRGFGTMGGPSGTNPLSGNARDLLADADRKLKEAEENALKEKEAEKNPLEGESEDKDTEKKEGDGEENKNPLDGDTPEEGDGDKKSAPSLTEEDQENPEIDPDSAADNPEEGTPEVSSDPDAPEAKQSTTISRGGRTFEMDSPQAARTAELIAPEDGTAPKTLRDAAAEAGFTVPADGPIGESVSPNNMRPGDFVIGGGEEGVYLGDGKVLTVNGVTPLDEIAQFDGVGEGVYRPALADGADPMGAADIPPVEDIPPAPEQAVDDAPPSTADAADIAAPPNSDEDGGSGRKWEGFTTESLFEGEDVEQKLAAPRGGDSAAGTQSASGHQGSLGSIPVAD